MRIVDVCAFYSPSGGGVKTYVERKLRAGAMAGHEVIILAPSDSDEVMEANGGRIVMMPARRFPLDRRYSYFNDEQSLHDMLDRLQPDLVEASSPWSSAGMLWATSVASAANSSLMPSRAKNPSSSAMKSGAFDITASRPLTRTTCSALPSSVRFEQPPETTVRSDSIIAERNWRITGAPLS